MTSLSLPQHDLLPLERRARVKLRRATLPIDHDSLAPFAVSAHLPPSQLPDAGWLLSVLDTLLKINRNNHHVDQLLDDELARVRTEITADVREANLPLIKQLAFRITQGRLRGRASRFEDFEGSFGVIPVPPVARDGLDDELFAHLRVAGPNPVWLRRATDDDVGPAIRAGHLPGDLQEAVDAGRAYVADYGLLGGYEEEHGQDEPKFAHAPLALFVVPPGRRRLKPAGIRIRATGPWVLPGDPRWPAARLSVQCADGIVHETIVHLARTHLLQEVVMLATLRELADEHPVRHLLAPHLVGTAFINQLAADVLLCREGAVDLLLAGTRQASLRLAAHGLQGVDLLDLALPRDLQRRGVDDVTALPVYPYRDRALPLWQAIHEWTTAWVETFYPDDADIREDAERQAWAAALVSPDGGRLRCRALADGGWGRGVLSELLAMLIFASSVQHAAVNYAQADLMTWAPIFPLALYARLEDTAQHDTLDLLPPLRLAHHQANILHLLGAVRFGSIDAQIARAPDRPALVEARRRLVHRMQEIEEAYPAPGEDRERYPYLRPSLVPPSTNI